MPEPCVQEVSLSTEYSEESSSESDSRESKSARSRPGSGAAGSESTPEVARNRCVDIRPNMNKERFEHMAWGEKYEGRYSFRDVDQADEEIKSLVGRAEKLKEDIEGYDCDLDSTYSKYRDAKYERRSIRDEIGRLEEEWTVQDQAMETAQEERRKLERRIGECKESKDKFEVQIKLAQEARQKLMGGRPYKRPLGEGSPAVPREQGEIGSTYGCPNSSVSKMDNEMVQNVVSRMALTSKSGGMPPPPKAGKGGGKGPDPLAKYPAGCTSVVDGILAGIGIMLWRVEGTQ